MLRSIQPGFIPDGEGQPTKDSAKFASSNRNKRSITIDISRPEGAALVRRLAADADVLVENYKVGDLARYGLDAETLRADNPGLIYLSVTGFGQTGPRRQVGALDAMIQAYAGFMSVNGEDGGDPLKSNVNVMDFTTGMYSAVALLLALYDRRTTGQGTHIDLSLFDCGVAMMSFLLLPTLALGEPLPRTGSRNDDWVPSGTFPTADRPVYLAVGPDAQFAALARAIGKPEWLENPDFAERARRRPRHAEIHALMQTALLDHGADHWVEVLSQVGVLAASVQDLATVAEDPQTKARGLMQTVRHAAGAEIPLVRNPVRMTDAAPWSLGPPPLLGQHTAEVLAEKLGLDAAEVETLRAGGVI